MGKWVEKQMAGGLSAALVLCVILGIALAAYAANGTYTGNRHWEQKWERFGATAGEAITAVGTPIALNRYNGRAYIADADDADRRPCVGLSGTSCVAGRKVEIVRRGILSGMPCGLGTELTNCVTPVGTPLMLSIARGGVTVVQNHATGVSQYLGYAAPPSQQALASGVTTSTDTYLIDVQAPRNTTAGAWY